MDEVMKQKIENDAAALMRRWSQDADATWRLRKAPCDIEIVHRAGGAVQHLIDYVASNEDDLFRQIDGKSFKRFNGQEVTLKLSGQPIVLFG